MFGTYFYHERVRRSVGAFGALFNNLYIMRKQKGGNVTSQVRVPLAFAPKRKFLERIEEDAKNELNEVHVIAVTLPRMSFEIVGMQYDPMRQLPRTQACIVTSPINSQQKQKIYTKTPYNIQFQLNIYAKSHDDALQVVEQIMPYFTPTYTLTMTPLDDYPQIKDDIPISMNGISFSDDNEGTLEQRRTIIYTLDFEMKLDIYGPQVDGKIIHTAYVDFFLDDDDSDAFTSMRVTTDPSPVSPDSDYSYVVETTRPTDA